MRIIDASAIDLVFATEPALAQDARVGLAVNEKTGVSGQVSVPMATAGARVSASCGLKFRDPDAKDLKAAAGIGISVGIFSIEIGQTSTWPELYIGPAIGAGPEVKTPVSPAVSVPIF